MAFEMKELGRSVAARIARRMGLKLGWTDEGVRPGWLLFAAVAIVFTIWTGGTFVGPRNVFNIAVQTVPVAIMACGMVFVIV